VLIAPAVVAMSPISDTPSSIRFLIAGVAVLIIVIAVTISTRRPVAIADTPAQPAITGPGESVEDTIEVQVKEHETESTN